MGNNASLNNMQPAESVNHQDKIDQQFEHITYLINNKQLNEAVDFLVNLHYADLADFLDNTSRRDYTIIFPAISSRLNPDVLACLNE